MIRKIIVLSLMILVIISSGFTARRSFASTGLTAFEEVDDYIITKMKELGIPGAALVIVEGDQIVHLKAFGVADASDRLVTPQTPFFTGSTGKSFTALAIMQLVEAGKVQLDAPVQTYLPWFRVADPNASEIITVRHLLNQISGLPTSIGQTQLAITDQSDFAIENNVRALSKVKLSSPPGERYEYSNANYNTLGMIIQAVTGKSYESYIEEHIFQPLDMQHSFTSKIKAQQDGLAVGYQKWLGRPVASPSLPLIRGSIAAGQLIMSAEDFGHYLIAQLNDGNYHDVSVLSPAGISALHHADVPMSGSNDFYGMAWEVQYFQDVEVIRHNGQVPGYTADMFLVPEKNIAVAMVMNTYSPMLGVRVSRLPSSVLRMLLDQEVIPGYEFPHMRLIYALVMLIPLLYIFLVVATFCRIRYWQSNHAQRPTRAQTVRFTVLPLVLNVFIAYILLIFLPTTFGANLQAMILFQPDVGWIAIISGIFALVWSFLRTGIVICMMR